jgi:NhaP-type Na+/H+ or K+/H+ antiporter
MSGAEHTNISGSIVLFVFVSLMLSVIVYELKKVVKIPVTPMLLVAGLVLKLAGVYIGDLKGAVELSKSLDHHIILLVLMPALIFETAFSTDWYTFKREFVQIIFLATTAVMLSTVLTALVIYYVVDIKLTWDQCMLFGAILSATDHVAVVAQLKEIHADHRLETLIQGETLMNEAAVLVFFFVFLERATGQEQGALESAIFFCRLSIGGFVFGLIFALAMTFWLKRIVNDEHQETNITILTTYLLFYTVEATPIHVSGAMAVVTFGLYMSAFGKTVISPLVEESVHGFWSLMGRNIEALIFIIGGMLLGQEITEDENVGLNDVWSMLIIFLVIHAVRAVVIAIHFPLLHNIGYGLTFKEAIVLTLAALKGAISLTLSLIVLHSGSGHDTAELKTMRSKMFFITIGVCACSILLDSFLVKIAVKYMGLETLTKVEEKMLIQVTSALVDEVDKKTMKLKSKKELTLTNWEEVDNVAGSRSLLEQVFNSTDTGKRIIKQHGRKLTEKQLIQAYQDELHLDDNDLIFETRRRFFTTLKGVYWQLFNKGQCMGNTAIQLIEITNICLDDEKKPIRDWELLQADIFPRKQMAFYRKFSKLPVLGKFFTRLLYDRVLSAYDFASAFKLGHHEAKELIDQMEIDLKPDIFEKVMEESKHQVKLCEEFLVDNITDTFPEVLRYVQTQKVCHNLLHSQRETIKEIYEHGVIGEIEYSKLINVIDKNMKTVTVDRNAELPELKDMLKNIFPQIPEHDLHALRSSISDTIIYNPGDILFREGDSADAAYLVLKGRIREYNSDYSKDHTVSEFVAVHHLIPDIDYCSTTAQTVSVAQVAVLKRKVISEVRSIEKTLWVQAAERLVILNKSQMGSDFKEVSNSDIPHLLQKCRYGKYKKGEVVDLVNGGLLIHGRFEELKAYSYVHPFKHGSLKTQSGVVFLHFPPALSDKLKVTGLSKAVGWFLLKGKLDLIKYSGKIPENVMQGFGLMLTGVLRDKGMIKKGGEQEMTGVAKPKLGLMGGLLTKGTTAELSEPLIPKDE